MNRLSRQSTKHSSEATVNNTTAKGIYIPDLRSRLKGQVITSEDSAYDQARTIFYGGIDRHPAAIIRAADAGDVAKVISLARETGIELAVRSGGHSFAGHSLSEGGLVLDLRDMRALQIDPIGRTAWAETGLTTGEYTNAADAYNLATGFGDTGSVGIGGITLGGGIGFLVRKHGLTIDNLLAAEIVTADGQTRRVDTENHPDLFWAIRGGGGNFGVVTRFQFRLHPLDTVVGGMLILPATPEAIAGFIAEAQAAPEELSTIANVMIAPPLPFVPEQARGKLILMAMLVYAGDIEAGQRAIVPFRTLTRPIADMVRPMRYPEIFPSEDKNYHPIAVTRTMFIDQVERDTAERMIEHLRASDAPMRIAQLRVLGGAMARVQADATAFAHRQARILVNLVAFYDKPEDRTMRENWVADFAADLDRGYSGAYVNFLSDEGEARVRAAYPGPTWDKLMAIKARYDPLNLFRVNHNIPPAMESTSSEEQAVPLIAGSHGTSGDRTL